MQDDIIFGSLNTSPNIKNLVTPTIAQFYNQFNLSVTELLHVSASSPSSGSLHQNVIKT